MITVNQIYWIAGILEGEGHFTVTQQNSTMIRLAMTDLDIITRARDIIAPGKKIGIKQSKREKEKDMFYFACCGSSAIQWMFTIYPLMGIRRKQKIREVVASWKKHQITDLSGFTKKLNSMNFSATNIELAKLLWRAGKKEDEILLNLERINAATIQ